MHLYSLLYFVKCVMNHVPLTNVHGAVEKNLFRGFCPFIGCLVNFYIVVVSVVVVVVVVVVVWDLLVVVVI